MFALVRIYEPTTIPDLKTGVLTMPESQVWERVVSQHEKWDNGDVRLLYVTRRHLQEDTSLIIDAKNEDALTNFLLTHIATMKSVRGIWVLPLTKMKFFEIPKRGTEGFNRFTITVNMIPEHLGNVYDSISALRPGRDIIVNYIALTFQSFKAPLMVCVLARSRNHVNQFVDRYIRPLEGVLDVETAYISKWLRLVSTEDWRNHVGNHIVPAGHEPIEDIEAEDDSLMSGC